MNPLAQIDEKSDIPPAVQMKLMQGAQQIQQLQQQIGMLSQEIRSRSEVAMIKEDGANRRKLMDVTARAYNTETINEAKVNQTNVKAITDQNKTEIDAILQLLLHNMDTNRLQMEIARRNAEQQSYTSMAESEVHQNANPFIGMAQQAPAAPAPAMMPGPAPMEPGMPGAPMQVIPA
jgi:hypothetical protein